MIGRLIKTARHRLGAQLPAPMAAPETTDQHRRRWRLIGLLGAMAVVTWMAPTLIEVSRFGTALLWLSLGLATLLQGTTWLTTKLRADAAWLDEHLEDQHCEIREP